MKKFLFLLLLILVVPALAFAGGEVTVNYNKATIESDLAGFKIYRNGDEIATIDNATVPNTYVDAGLADGTYSYQLSAFDTSGNESTKSPAASITFDTTAPAGGTDISVTVTVNINVNP